MEIAATEEIGTMAEKYHRERDDDRGDRDGYDGGDEERGSRRFQGGGFYRKKPCRFCKDEDSMLDYKNPRMMQSFVTEHGRILPRRMTGMCAFHQRALGTALKKARQLAIVGYVSPGW